MILLADWRSKTSQVDAPGFRPPTKVLRFYDLGCTKLHPQLVNVEHVAEAEEILRLSQLRSENRAHFFADPIHADYQKHLLIECFCPYQSSWRSKVIDHANRIINQAIQAVFE